MADVAGLRQEVSALAETIATQGDAHEREVDVLKGTIAAQGNTIAAQGNTIAAQGETHEREVAVLKGTIATQGNTIATLDKVFATHNRRHVKILLRAAASRIEELVIQDALSITRSQMRGAELFSIDRVERMSQRNKKSERIGLPSFVNGDFIRLAVKTLPGMRERLASIKATPGVVAGIATVLKHGGSAAHEDPADEQFDWEQLGNSVALVFRGTPDFDNVQAMARAYVAARMAATTEQKLEHVQTPPAGLFAQTCQ